MVSEENANQEVISQQEEKTPMQQKLAKYTDFTLSADLSNLSDNQKEIVKILIDAAESFF